MRQLTCRDLEECFPESEHCHRCAFTGDGSEDAECNNFPNEIEVEGYGLIEVSTCCSFSLGDLLDEDTTPSERAELLKSVL